MTRHRLWIWDYATNFSYYLLPFPNERMLDDNLRSYPKPISKQCKRQEPLPQS